MSKTIFFIAGESSGDALGAPLIKAIRERAGEPIEVIGIGGPLMEAQGLQSLLPMDELCIMGIWEVLMQLPRLLHMINGVVEEIEAAQPDIVVTIDLPDFNFQVGSRLKKRGIFKGKIIHYVAPTVWAWRPGRAKKVAQFLDGIMCLFPFEPEHFEKEGLKAEFVGHPLIQTPPDAGDSARFREMYDIRSDDVVCGIFFGSRASELKGMGQVLKDSAILLHDQFPSIKFVVPTLPHLEYDVLHLLEGFDAPVSVISDPDLKQDAIAACNAAVAVSGTVGLELAYHGIPHLIAYKAHPITWEIVRRLVKVKYAHLANILLDEEVISEYLQLRCQPLPISKALIRLIRFEDERARQLEKTEKLQSLLGRGHKRTPSEKAADFILQKTGKAQASGF